MGDLLLSSQICVLLNFIREFNNIYYVYMKFWKLKCVLYSNDWFAFIDSVARFLESRGMIEDALEVATDPDYRFELAIQLGRLEVAKVSPICLCHGIWVALRAFFYLSMWTFSNFLLKNADVLLDLLYLSEAIFIYLLFAGYCVRSAEWV